MPVVSSEIIDDRVINGVRVVEMRYVDDDGRACYCSHKTADLNEDCRTVMLNRVPTMEAQFTDIKNMPRPIPDSPEVKLGEGVPTFDAPDGQFYLDTVTFNLYVRVGGSW